MAVTNAGGPHWPGLAPHKYEDYISPPRGQPPQIVSPHISDHIASEDYYHASNTNVSSKPRVDKNSAPLRKPRSSSSLFSPPSSISKVSFGYVFETNQSQTEHTQTVSAEPDIHDTKQAATESSLRPSFAPSRSSSFRSLKNFWTSQTRVGSQEQSERLPSFLGRHQSEDIYNPHCRSFSVAGGTRELHTTAWSSTRYRVPSFGKPNIPTRAASLNSIQEANTSRKLDSRSISVSSAEELKDLLFVNKEPLFIDLPKTANRDLIFPTRASTYIQEVSPLLCRTRRISSHDNPRRSRSSIHNADSATPLVYKSRSSASLQSRRNRQPVFVPKIIIKTTCRHKMFGMNPLSVGDATVDEEGELSGTAEYGHHYEGTTSTTGAEHGGSGEQELAVASGSNAVDATRTYEAVHGTVTGHDVLEQGGLVMAPSNRLDTETVGEVGVKEGEASKVHVIHGYSNASGPLPSVISQDDADAAVPDHVLQFREQTERRLANFAYSPRIPEENGGLEPFPRFSTSFPNDNEHGTVPQVTDFRNDMDIQRSDDPDFNQSEKKRQHKGHRFHRISNYLKGIPARLSFRRHATRSSATVGVEASARDSTSNSFPESQNAGEGQPLDNSTESSTEPPIGDRRRFLTGLGRFTRKKPKAQR
ncbi:MAG: hypothetical protein M1812_002150 [Candelaria pacifica]|nr:MAG: hypothetical protein M1812_002150 [Candelaria pacifica]